MYYTGIGSRETPLKILNLMTETALYPGARMKTSARIRSKLERIRSHREKTERRKKEEKELEILKANWKKQGLN